MKNLMLFALAICLLSTSCDNINSVGGEGAIVTETLDVSSFSSFTLKGPFNVNIEQGTTQKVVAEGHANIIDKLKTEVNNNVFTAGLQNGTYNDFELTLYITVVDISKIMNDGAGNIFITSIDENDLILQIDGVGNIEVSDYLKIDDFTQLGIDGAGNIKIQDLETMEAELNLDGVGNISVAGNSSFSKINLEGSGTIKAFRFETTKVDVHSDGVGSIEVFAEEELDVAIDGVGNVYYKGTPTIQSSIDGIGKLINAN